ncbi:origin of replication complex subunit 2-like [Papaver somniferum]|uniref:origin of replication complex subunit 2-like n=1 Tax=Papaver somniferum TaxID=3469 RepID=UPI000E6FD045|nr:origin of replication complex subunit 2-like [Papaver somniferum]
MDLVKGRLTVQVWLWYFDVQVVSTLAEILWEQQLKTIRISSTGRTSKVQKPSSLQSMEYLLAFLDGTDAKENDCFVYVFIHNINGPGLRDSESQHYLALLANCSNIRVVASINHVNTVLYIGRKIWKTKAYVNRTYRASQGPCREHTTHIHVFCW